MANEILPPNLVSLTHVAPDYPDFHLCDRAYGQHLTESDCLVATELLSSYISQHPLLSLPRTGTCTLASTSHGDCFLTLEIAGPAFHSLQRIDATIVDEMASWVILQCVVINTGIGGFITLKLTNLIDYVTQPGANFADEFPPDSAFLTVSVTSSPENSPEPGNYDPAIPLAISEWEINTWTGNTLQHRLDEAYEWSQQAEYMTRGESLMTWWQWPSSTTADEMTYECDSDLGSPSVTDCAQIEWQQLSPASDRLTVGPGSTHFLHSDTCYVAISAITTVVLSWEQIRAAIFTLMNMCVQHPFQPVQGGRAYHELRKRQPINKGKLRRGDNHAFNGWNALPALANITLFQQVEAFKDPATALASCT